jgi:hypothetical protein
MPAKSTRQRADERRQEKLREVQRQIDDGTLVVRKMSRREQAAHEARRQDRKGS